jgi:hypothetical protein
MHLVPERIVKMVLGGDLFFGNGRFLQATLADRK